MSDTLLPARFIDERRALDAVVRIVLNWVFIFLALFLVSRYPSFLGYFCAFVFIGIQQHALGLWMHESAHWLLAKNKSLNDLISTILLSGPLLVPLRIYRARHFTHHGYLGTAQDTKGTIFTLINGRYLIYFFLKSCSGLQLVQIALGYFSKSASQEAAAKQDSWIWLRESVIVLVIQLGLFSFISLISSPVFYLFLWILPWLTINRFIAGIRSIIEHQPLASEAHPFTRSFSPTWFDRLVFCRAGFDHHWVHHRYPNLPWFNLDKIELAPELRPHPLHPTYLSTLLVIVRSR